MNESNSVKERLCDYLKFKRISKSEFSDSINVSKAYVNSIRASIKPDKLMVIKEIYPDLNIDWLLTGLGKMLNHESNALPIGQNVIQGNNNSHISQVNGHFSEPNRPFNTPKPPIQDAEAVEVCEECGKPVSVPLVPASIAQSKDEDVWAYINAHKVPRTPVVHQFPNYDMTYQIHSDAMAPRLKSGDYVALRHIGSHPKIFNGEVYCIDTKNTGFIVREVSNMPDGYRLHARSERYGDDFIAYDDVIGVYEVVGAVIMTI